jgi:hypothetical protein
MNIGILTFINAQDNYGQVLQAFALKNYLENEGHLVYFINYDRYKDIIFVRKNIRETIGKIFNPIIVIRHLLNLFNRMAYKKSARIHDRKFDSFREKYFRFTIKYNSLSELKENPPNMDMYITGSDQVWNFPDIIHYRNNFHAFFLNFGKAIKISYAASFGNSDLSKEYYDLMLPLLNDFSAISVREMSGVDILRRMGFNNVKLVPDPTFLINTEYWKQLADHRIDDDNFICCYLLGSQTDVSLRKIIYKIRHKKYYYIPGQERFDLRKKIYPTIEQWLGFLLKANCIITNSYHGLIFSLIFQKKFIVLSLKGKYYENMNTRIQSLLSFFSLENRILSKKNIYMIDELMNTNIKYNEIEEKMKDFIISGKIFLDTIQLCL